MRLHLRCSERELFIEMVGLRGFVIDVKCVAVVDKVGKQLRWGHAIFLRAGAVS